MNQQAKLNRLRSLIPFVLDNSLRETSVVQIRGHTSEDKDAILDAISTTGIQHMIVGPFDAIFQVDDDWLKTKRSQHKTSPYWYAFSEMWDSVAHGRPDITEIPTGLQRIQEYSIQNIIFEMDILWDDHDHRSPIKLAAFPDCHDFVR